MPSSVSSQFQLQVILNSTQSQLHLISTQPQLKLLSLAQLSSSCCKFFLYVLKCSWIKIFFGFIFLLREGLKNSQRVIIEKKKGIALFHVLEYLHQFKPSVKHFSGKFPPPKILFRKNIFFWPNSNLLTKMHLKIFWVCKNFGS